MNTLEKYFEDKMNDCLCILSFQLDQNLLENKNHLYSFYIPHLHIISSSKTIFEVIDLSEVPDMQLELGLSPSDFYLPSLSIREGNGTPLQYSCHVPQCSSQECL